MGSSNEMEQVDLIDRQAAIDALTHKWDGMVTSVFDVINSLPSAQPDIARDIAAIIENEKDMRVILAQPEIIYCKDCKHKPHPSDSYDYDNGDCGFEIIFPNYRCPCQCDDAYYNRLPDDNWFCGNAERRTDG